MTTNRLVIGLLFPNLKDIDSFNLSGTLNIFMEDWKKEELQLKISTLFSNDMTEQDDVNYGSEITGTSIFKNEEQVDDVVEDYESKVYLRTKLKRKLILYELRDTKKRIASGIAPRVILTSDTWMS